MAGPNTERPEHAVYLAVMGTIPDWGNGEQSMPRALNKSTLDGAVRDYAVRFLLPTVWSRNNPNVAIDGRDWVLQSMYNFHYKDEFDYIRKGMEGYMGQDALNEFKKASKDIFTPRANDVFEQLLEERLAIRPDGSIIKGKLGTCIIGERIVGYRPKLVKRKRRNGGEFTIMKPVKEPVYAGDLDYMASINAASLTMSAETAILMLDAMVDNLDEGTGAAVISGYSGTRPADPDAAITGTLLFRNTMSATAFGAAVDDTDGTVSATAASITDDSSADNTGTASHFRVSATNDGSTPLDDHIDGNIGTSGEDLNLNTVSIVSGATVSITSYVMNLSQGSGAT